MLRTSRRARAAAALTVVALALALAGCSSDGDSDEATEDSPTTTAADAGSGGEEGGGEEAAGGDLDPRALEDSCAIFDASTIEDVLGEPVDYPSSNLQTYEIGCTWSTASGPFAEYRLETERPGQEAYDGVTQYLEVTEGSEELDLGDQAIINVDEASTGELAVIDAIINGWYVSIRVGEIEGAREKAIELAEILEGSLVAFTPMEEGSGSEGASGGSSSEVPGTLLDMEVTIDAPAELAGTTTLDELDIVGIAGFATCSVPGSPIWVLQFNAPPATEPPTPVGVFGITVEDGIDVGETKPAQIGVGVGMSDVATTTSYEGTVTVNDEGTGGSFEATGGPSGTWSCEWAE